MSGMALFDLEDFEPEPVYEGPSALLRFTRDYFDPDDIITASRFAPRGSHTWRTGVGSVTDRGPRGCVLTEFSADLRCDIVLHGDRMSWRQASPEHLWAKDPGFDHSYERCQCVGGLVTMVVCAPCRWNHVNSESDALIAWLDHAWEGWRELPTIPVELVPPTGGALHPKNGSPNPADVRAGKAAHAWAVEHFPVEWQVPGAPASAYYPRHTVGVIPGYVPFGGLLVAERAVAA